MSTTHSGVLNIRKQSGWTSHDVVAKVRRLAGQKRVGHAGTLDPLAEGVLPVLLGRATRLVDAIQGGEKRYEAEVRLGIATSTDDAEGEIVTTAPVPALDRDTLESTLAQFRGTVEQLPPAYSAIKVQGQRAYAVARKGGRPELQARQVTIHDLRLLDIRETCLLLDIHCSRGTYIRALARDLATALGTVGHLTRLVRTQVGPFRLDDAVTLETVAECGVDAVLLQPDAALPDAPVYTADANQASRLANGQHVATRMAAPDVWVRDPAGHLVCLATANGEVLRPRIVLA